MADEEKPAPPPATNYADSPYPAESSEGSGDSTSVTLSSTDSREVNVLPLRFNVRSASASGAQIPSPESADAPSSSGRRSNDPETLEGAPRTEAEPFPPSAPDPNFGPETPPSLSLTSLRPVPVLLDDPLREVARKERRSLLGVNVIAILVGATGLVPEKIENFGITFAPSERRALLFVFLGVVVYYYAAFIIYAWGDYLNHSNKVFEAQKALKKQMEEPRALTLGVVQEDRWGLEERVIKVSRSRTIFDFFVTGLVALLAVGFLAYGALTYVDSKPAKQKAAHYDDGL
jgi:hypothetical protein